MKLRSLPAAVFAAVLSTAGLLALAAAAPAAQLEADFHFNGTRTAPSGETIADVGDGNAFAAESVDDAMEPRQVLTFPAGGGFTLPTTSLAGSGSYSVVVLLRLEPSTTGRRKLMDFSGGTSDAGLYLCDGTLLIEPLAVTPCPLGSGADSDWAQVVLTRDGDSDEVQAYLGDDRPSADDPLGALALGAALRLFVDDDQLPADEHSAGAIARLRVYDGVLTAGEVDALDRVDVTPPDVSLESVATPTTDSTPAFSGAGGTEAGDLATVAVKVYSGSSAAGTPLHTISATRDGGSWAATPSEALPDGTYTARAEQSDGAGNGGTSEARTFTIDRGAPAVGLATPAAGPTNDSTPTYSGAAGDAPGDSPTVTVEVFEGSAATGDPAHTLTATRTGGSWSVDGEALTDGTYTARAEQADEAGNTGTSQQTTFTVDTVAPGLSLDTPSAGMTNDPTPAFGGQAGDAPGDSATVTVNVYSGGSASGSPVQTLTATRSGDDWSVTGSEGLADGTYTARAEQIDGADNTGTTPARTFTVDTAGPAVSLTTPSGGATNDATPSYAGAAGDAPGDDASVIVSVYSGSSTSGSLVQTLTATRSGSAWSVDGSPALTDGTYTARAEQTDEAGNTGTSVARTFTVDTAAPGVSMDSPPAATSDRTPTYRGAAGDATGDSETVTVQVFGGSAAEGDPVQTVTATRSGAAWSQDGSPALPDGTYTAQAEQGDDAGNESQSSARTFTVDGAGPSVSLDTPGAGTSTSDSTPTYGGAAGDAPGDLSTVTLELYGGSAASGTPIQTLTEPRAGAMWSKVGSPPLPDGTYTAQAKQSDSVGNVNVSQPRTFSVDTIRPDTAITSAPADATGDSTPEFAFSSPDGAGFVCRLYPAGGASAPAFDGCSSPRVAGPLADGSYVFQVAAVDAAGNQDDSPGSRTFRVDTTAPQVTLSIAPGDTIATDAAFVFAASEAASFTCRLDGGPWEPCASPRFHSGLPLGPHAFEVSASDQAGNQGGTTRHEWQVLKPGAIIPAAGLQAVALAQDVVELRRALKRVPLPRAARRGAITVAGVDALTHGTIRLLARARGATFALGRYDAPAAGSYRFKLTLTRQGRRLARRVPKLRVDLKLSFTDSVGRVLKANTTTTMVRRPPAARPASRRTRPR